MSSPVITIEIDRSAHDASDLMAEKGIRHLAITQDGQIVGHEGAWISGQDGAHFGMLLPGQPKVGQKYYAEMAPRAKDRCEVKDTNAKVTTPLLGTFNGCLKIDETSPIEKSTSHKVYAPNVGLIQDDEMTLVRVEGGAGK